MHFLHFLFLLVRITFVKPNMFLTCARKTGSHPGGGRLPDTHRRPPVPPSSPTSVDPPHLVPLPSHRTLVRLPGTRLPGCAPALSPARTSSYLYPTFSSASWPLPGIPVPSPVPLSSHLGAIFPPGFCPLTISPERAWLFCKF